MFQVGPDPGATLRALPDAVVVADTENHIVGVNPAVFRLLGYEATELVGRPLTTLMPERYREAHLAGFTRLIDTGVSKILGQPIRLPALHRDGSEIPVDLLLTTFTEDGERYVLGTLRDVAGRVKIEHRQAIAARLLEVLAAAETIGEAAPLVLGALGRELEWDIAVLWVADESRRRLRSAALWQAPGLGADDFAVLTEALAFTPGEGLPGRVWEDRKPAWIDDLATDPNFPRAGAAAEAGIRGAYAFPLTTDSQVLGVIELLRQDARRPDQAMIDTMSALGELVGEFLERQLSQEALDASRQRLELALEGGRMGTWELDLQTGELTWSAQAAALIGLDAEVAPSSVEAYVALVLAEDRAQVRAVLNGVAGWTEPFREQHRVIRSDGSLRWLETVGRAVRDAAGRRALVGIVTDITERKAVEQQREQLLADQEASRRRMKFLADASAELASSLEHRHTLSAVAQRTAAELGDWCRFYAFDRLGPLYVVAAAAASPALGELLDDLDRRFPPQLADAFGPGRAARTGNPEFHPDVQVTLLSRAARDPDHLEALSRVGLRSYMAVPMTVQDRVVGVLAVGAGGARPRYTGEDLALAEELARRAAQALENSRLYQDLERVARALQASLLPPDLPELPGLEIAARYRPVGQSEVGGDFYDIFPLRGDTWGIVVGDVRGKGPAAATVTGLARWAVRGAAMQTKRPHRVLANLNATMLAADSDDEPRFATVVFGRLRPSGDGYSLSVASGGHPLPLAIRADGEIEPLGGAGMLVGAVADADFTSESYQLDPGDSVVFYTDGVLEARHGRELLGDAGFVGLLREAAGDSPEEVIAHIEERVEGMDPGPRDDIALLVLRVR